MAVGLNLADLIKLASLASIHSAHVIEAPTPLPDTAVQTYWHAARERNHTWIRQMGQRNASPADSSSKDRSNWKPIRSTITEVFVGEVLTRVWTAILVAADRHRGVRHAEPIARSVLIGHLEARRCALDLMVNASDITLQELAELDRIRRRVERWTDLLMGYLVVQYDVGEFAFEELRARDFARDQLSEGASESVRMLVLAGAHLAFSGEPMNVEVKSADQQRVVQSVFECFPSDAFCEFGPLKSLSTLRLGRSGLVPESPPKDLMVHPEFPLPATEPPAPTSPRTGISFRRLRRARDS